MPPTSAFIDTNLLVLLVVGAVDRDLVSQHRRTRSFTPEDFDTLSKIDMVFVTPNTLTEASNLLKDSQDTRPMKLLRILIHRTEEVHVASQVAANNPKFTHLGLTDTVLLESVSPERPLITVDFELYGAALAKGYQCAYNFTHWQAW